MSRPYISNASTTLDPGSGNAITKQTAQVLDQYGNVTSMSLYDFGSPTVAVTVTNSVGTSSAQAAQMAAVLPGPAVGPRITYARFDIPTAQLSMALE